MNKSTKELFELPWFRYDDCDDCENFAGIVHSTPNDYYPIASRINSRKMSKRFVRFPEVYDALLETLYYKCFECMGGLRHNIDLTREELVENGCPKKNPSAVCIFCKYLKLLKTVRDAK